LLFEASVCSSFVRSTPSTLASPAATSWRWFAGTWSGDTNAEYTVVLTTSCVMLRSNIAPRTAGSSATSRNWAAACEAS